MVALNDGPRKCRGLKLVRPCFVTSCRSTRGFGIILWLAEIFADGHRRWTTMNFNPMVASRPRATCRAAHMTWATSSVGRSISRTGVFLKKQIWIWPIMAVVLLSIIGLGVRHAIVNTMENGLRSELQTLLDVETAMLETWFHSQRSNAESLANGVDLRRLVYQLLDDSASNSTTHAKDEKSVGQVQAQLDKTLAPALSAHDYTRYLIADKSKRIVAATSRELIGQQDVPEYDSFLSRARRRDLRLNAFPQNEWRKDEKRRLLRTGGANDVRHAPDRDESFQVVAVLGCAFDRSKSLHDPAVGPRRQYR